MWWLKVGIQEFFSIGELSSFDLFLHWILLAALNIFRGDVEPNIDSIHGAYPSKHADWASAFKAYSDAYANNLILKYVKPNPTPDASKVIPSASSPSSTPSSLSTNYFSAASSASKPGSSHRNVSDSSSKYWVAVDPLSQEDWDSAEREMRLEEHAQEIQKWRAWTDRTFE